MPREEDQALLFHITQQLKLSSLNKIVFGDPIYQDDVIIVPVAKARFGFGFGRGKSPQQDSNGEGGGGGVYATPVGYIEIKNGESKFIRTTKLSFGKMILGIAVLGYVFLKITREFNR